MTAIQKKVSEKLIYFVQMRQGIIRKKKKRGKVGRWEKKV